MGIMKVASRGGALGVMWKGMVRVIPRISTRLHLRIDKKRKKQCIKNFIQTKFIEFTKRLQRNYKIANQSKSPNHRQ